MGRISGAIDLYCAALSFALMAIQLKRYKGRPGRVSEVLFMIMQGSGFFMLLSEGIALTFFQPGSSVVRILLTFCVISAFCLMAVYTKDIAVITNTRETKKTLRALYLSFFLCGALIILWIVNCISPFMYDFSKPGFTNKALAVIVYIVGIIVIVTDDVFILRSAGSAIKKADAYLMVFLPLLPFLFLILKQKFSDLYLVCSAVFFILIVFYLHINSQVESKVRDQQLKIDMMRVRSTFERIKPHYIYNVLTSIYYLCDTDASVAQEAIGIFSDYLRDVLNIKEKHELIPFSRELHTVKNYLELEKMRFGDSISVKYDIRCGDFLIPPFVMQPVVENSVKHGTEKKNGRCDIRVFTRESDKGYLIVVKDDCGGFDTSILDRDDDENHTGIRYVRDILKMTVDGKLDIQSEIGKGTTVSIYVPKKT